MANCFSRERVEGFLHTQGRIMVNGKGEEVILRGWGMGNWNNPEGFMVGGTNGLQDWGEDFRLPGRMDRARSMSTTIAELCGTAYRDAFWPRWYRNYLGEKDIAQVAEDGYNSIRLPLCAWAFLPEEPGYHWNEDSFAMLDQILDWCEQYRIYAILDLHAAPGGQSGIACDDGLDNVPHMFEAENYERTIRLWEELASRYKDRWIVGGYDLLNEPLSPPQWDYLLPQLSRFYDELIARIRKIDRRHMLSIEGHRFSSRLEIFDRDMDPECHNWCIHVHCYGASPEPGSMMGYLAKSAELNVPVWLGETNGSNDWMATFFEMHVQYHIGFNMWCWKIADQPGVSHHGYGYPLPEAWALVRDYCEGGTKPSFEKSQAIFDELLENVKFENCRRIDLDSDRHILRRPGIAIPAVSYDPVPGRGLSFDGGYAYGNLFDFRLPDGVHVMRETGYVAPDKPHWTQFMKKKPGRDHRAPWRSHLLLGLRDGSFACYTIRDVTQPCPLALDYYADEEAELLVEIPGCPERAVLLAPSTDKPQRIELGTIPEGEEVQVKLTVASGRARLQNIRFGC